MNLQELEADIIKTEELIKAENIQEGDTAKSDQPTEEQKAVEESVSVVNQEEQPQQTQKQEVNDTEDQTWKHKYSVVNGMLKKVSGENRELRGQITNLTNEITKLTDLITKREAERVVVEPKQEIVEEPFDVNKLLTREEIEQLESKGFSAEDIKAFANISSKSNSKILDNLRKEIDSLKAERETSTQQMSQQVQGTAERVFWNEMNQRCPDYQSINDDEAFTDWIHQKLTPYTNETRYSIIQGGMKTLNPIVVSAVFNEYKSLVNQAKKNLTTNVTQSQTQTSQSRLAKQVVPSKSSSAAVNVKSEPKYWTMDEIDKEYTKFRLGQYSKEEQEKINNEIDKAIRENRIR